MARVVVSEFMDEPAVAARLRAVHDVVYDPGLVDDAARLRVEAAAADALIVRNRTQVRGELLAALACCKVVGRLGVGLDNIDVPACEARGMRVIPAAGANALAVAEYVIGTAMLLGRAAFTCRAPRSPTAAGRARRCPTVANWPARRSASSASARSASGSARSHRRSA